MNTLQILEVLKKVPANSGVFPADRIPENWTKPTAFVFNTKNHDDPGEHWVAVYVDRNGRAIYFDSYGEPPNITNHLRRIRKNCTFYDYNKRQLQSYDSSVCGQYCVLFLHFMCIGLSLHQFHSIFTNDTIENDKLVHEYYKKFNNRRPIASHNFTGNGQSYITQKHVQTCRCLYG